MRTEIWFSDAIGLLINVRKTGALVAKISGQGILKSAETVELGVTFRSEPFGPSF